MSTTVTGGNTPTVREMNDAIYYSGYRDGYRKAWEDAYTKGFRDGYKEAIAEGKRIAEEEAKSYWNLENV